jgi:hypothetical protein
VGRGDSPPYTELEDAKINFVPMHECDCRTKSINCNDLLTLFSCVERGYSTEYETRGLLLDVQLHQNELN